MQLGTKIGIILIRPLSSYARRCFTLHQVHCRAEIDTLFYSVLCWFSQSSSYLVPAFEALRLGIFWKINLDRSLLLYKKKKNWTARC
jgi:hypothetical protein